MLFTSFFVFLGYFLAFLHNAERLEPKEKFVFEKPPLVSSLVLLVLHCTLSQLLELYAQTPFSPQHKPSFLESSETTTTGKQERKQTSPAISFPQIRVEMK